MQTKIYNGRLYNLEFDLFAKDGQVLSHEQFVAIGKRMIKADICDKPPDIMRPDREQAGKLTLKMYMHPTRYGQAKNLKGGGIGAFISLLDAEQVGAVRLAAFAHERQPLLGLVINDSTATIRNAYYQKWFGEQVHPLRYNRPKPDGVRLYNVILTMRAINMGSYPVESWQRFFYEMLTPAKLVSSYEPEIVGVDPDELLLRSLSVAEVVRLVDIIDTLPESVGYFRMNLQPMDAKGPKTPFSTGLRNYFQALTEAENLAASKSPGIVIGNDGIRPL